MPSASFTAAVAALLGIEDGAQSARVAARAAEVTAWLPGPAGLGVRAAAAALDVTARLRFGRPLAGLDPGRRDVICQLAAARGGQFLDAVKMPLLLAAGAELSGANPVLSAPPEGRPDAALEPPRPDAALDCVPSSGWPDRWVADAVVIGSGAGGAMAARTLARAGLSVVIVEAGRRYTVAEFRGRPPLNRFMDLYAGHGITICAGRPPVLLMSASGVGGTTLVNSGTCFRPPAGVVDNWQRRFGLDLGGFDALLAEVERTLQVAPQPVGVLGRNGLLALEGAARLGWKASPLRRNAPGCAGSCQCAVGCPTNAKNGVHLNALPQACGAGVRIITRARVQRVLTEPARRPAGGPRGVKAAGVRAVRPDGSPLEILAPLVVVACGALQTPLLLRRSGLGRHPALGRWLAIHPAVSIAGRFDEPVVSWSGVLQSVGIEQLQERGILIEATASPPGMHSFVLPGVGRRLRSELAAADRLAFLGAMVADAPSGRVRGHRRPLVSYQLGGRDAAALREAIVAMGRVLFAAGAREVLTGLAARPRARSVADLAEIAGSARSADLHIAAFHPTGSARMGADSLACPVDPSGRLRGADGVYVADASVLPSCPRVNPQLAIMALALAVADHAAARA